jgi:hypothetical protein
MEGLYSEKSPFSDSQGREYEDDSLLGYCTRIVALMMEAVRLTKRF